MTSKFNTETMSTMKRIGKPTQKTANISTSKRQGTTKNSDQMQTTIQHVRAIFQNKLPVPLRSRESEQDGLKKEEKKFDTKDDTKELSVNPEQSATVKKEETSNDLGTSEMEQSDDEHKKREMERKAESEKNLDQIQYICITETPTTILFYCPSTKYLTIKNDEEIAEQKNRAANYNEYLSKLKNRESFVDKSAQTINRFKSTQVVSTPIKEDSFTDVSMFRKEVPGKKVNCLNYVITDSLAEKRTNDEPSVQLQKIIDKKIKKELKRKLKHSSELLTVDSSMRSMKKTDMNESVSISDTIISSGLQSSRRPRATRSNAGASQEKSQTNNERKSSPNSSMIRNSTNSEHQALMKERDELIVNKQEIKRAPNEELPKTLSNSLKFVERLLSQNKYQFRQFVYKDYPINTEEFEIKQKSKGDAMSLVMGDENQAENDQNTLNIQKEIALISSTSDEPNIKKLFCYSLDGLLKERGINTKYVCHAMDWNSQNEDLLAAVYGDPDINSKNPGFLCFWTLKDPLHPERVIQTPRGLTYCNFSRKSPYLIVVSDYTGEIMIYDLRNNTAKPYADSSEVKDKHTDIVWECKWIERPNDKNEIIVTTSSDGKIKEWSLKKGLEVTDLLKMKKTTSFPMKQLNPFANYLKKNRKDASGKEGKEIKDTLIFREGNGLSFDFPKNDTTIYYVALEECTIHRCRISYKDQYTDNYYGHQGPVYKIRCNPFDPNILISCSYDWTLKLWNNKLNYSVMNLHTNELSHQVNDIEWSNDTSTVFACVADDGRIEIWDLARKAIQPIIIEDIGTAAKKSIKFAKGAKIIATGNAEGNIDVFRIYNMEHSPVSDEHQIKHLQNVIEQNSDITMKS